MCNKVCFLVDMWRHFSVKCPLGSAVLDCGLVPADLLISVRTTSLALGQSHWGNHIAPVPVKQHWRIQIIESHEPTGPDDTYTRTTNSCAYFVGCTLLGRAIYSLIEGSWGQHGAHLGPTGPKWAPCWPHEPCCKGYLSARLLLPPNFGFVHWLVVTSRIYRLTLWSINKHCRLVLMRS